MNCQVESLHRSISYPANLQSNLPVITLFALLPPELPHTNTSSSMDSDTNSNTTVYNIISQINNSDLKTPDEFDNSEPSLSTLSQPPFQQLHSRINVEPPSTPSSITNVTPTYSPLTSEPPDNNRSVNTQISNELDNFVTLQRQLQHPQTLTIHQLSQSITSSNPSTPTPSPNPTSSSNSTPSTANRAYRTLRRKFPKIPSAQSFVNHPLHTNTKEILQVCLPFFPSIHLLSFRL